jgi:hypothetical protein
MPSINPSVGHSGQTIPRSGQNNSSGGIVVNGYPVRSSGGGGGSYGAGWDSNTMPDDTHEPSPPIICAVSARTAPVNIDYSNINRPLTAAELNNVKKVEQQLRNLRAAFYVMSNYGLSFKIDGPDNAQQKIKQIQLFMLRKYIMI